MAGRQATGVDKAAYRAPKRKLIEGWPLEAIALHLEAITFGDIKRLLINVPRSIRKDALIATLERPSLAIVCSSVCLLRFNVWSSLQRQTPIQPGNASSNRAKGPAAEATLNCR
jgi:hypothetical protein